MAERYYITPITGDGLSMETRRRPQYFDGIFGWGAMDYGLEPVMLVGADVSDAQHTSISGNVDVISFPLNLSANISAGALPQVKAALEGLNIPANWITTANTYRQVLKAVATIFLLGQRAHGLGQGRLFPSGVTLATTFSELSTARKNRLREMAESFGFDTSGLTGASTMRQMLKALADQRATPIRFRGVDI